MTNEKKNAAQENRWSGSIITGLVLLLVLLALALQLSVVRYPVARITEAVRYPYQLDGEEGFLLAQAMRVADGPGLYLPIGERPYVVDNYPPLYPVLWSCFVNSDAPSLAPGRVIAALGEIAVVVAILLTALAIGISFRPDRQSGNLVFRLTCLFIATLAIEEAARFVGSVEVMRWSAYARVDMPAVGLATLGLALFFLGDTLISARRSVTALRVAGFILMIFALLTKQTAIAAPAACVCWLLWRRQWKRAFKYALSGGVIIALLTLIFILMTQGQYWLHTVTYNRNVMHWPQLWLELRGLWRQHWPLIIAFTLLAFALGLLTLLSPKQTAEKRDKDKKPIALFGFYLLLNLLSLVSLAKAGAAENYKIETHAAVALFIATALPVLLTYALATHRMLFKYISTAVAIAVLAMITIYAWRQSIGHRAQGYYITAPRPTYMAYTKGQSLVAALRDTPGDILCEDPIYLIHAGKPILMQNFIMSQLSKEDRWDDTLVIAPMQSGQVPLVIAYADLRQDGFYPRYTPAILETIRKYYHLAGVIQRTGKNQYPGTAPPLYVFQYNGDSIE